VLALRSFSEAVGGRGISPSTKFFCEKICLDTGSTIFRDATRKICFRRSNPRATEAVQSLTAHKKMPRKKAFCLWGMWDDVGTAIMQGLL
jgi:hypothetical protein